MGLLSKPVLPSHLAPPPSGGRPVKALKQNEIPTEALSKEDLKKQRKAELLKNPKTLTDTLLTVKKPGNRIATMAITKKERLPTQILPGLRQKQKRGREKAAMVLRTKPKVAT